MTSKTKDEEKGISRLQVRMLQASKDSWSYSNAKPNEAEEAFYEIPEHLRIGLKLEFRPLRSTGQVGRKIKAKTHKTGCFFRQVNDGE